MSNLTFTTEILGHHDPDGWAEAAITVSEGKETLEVFRVRVQWQDINGDGERMRSGGDLMCMAVDAAGKAGRTYISLVLVKDQPLRLNYVNDAAIYLREAASDIKSWVVDMFGAPVYHSKKERALRLLEEAVELAQAEGIQPRQMRDIIDRHAYRDKGTASEEFGDVLFTALAYAGSTNLDPLMALEAAFQKTQELDKEKMRLKHLQKCQDGTTDPEAPVC